MSFARNPISNCNGCEEYWYDYSTETPQCTRHVCDSCGDCEGIMYAFHDNDFKFDLCQDCFVELQTQMIKGAVKIKQGEIPTPAVKEIIIVNRKSITEEERDFIFSRDNYRCVECGSEHKLQIDHIHPFSKGGKTTSDNLRTLCKPCNCKKGDRTTQK